jgi:hypothetical protein
LASTLRSLSFKRKDELPEDCEQLQQQQSADDPHQTLETAYVAHVSLSWEALHCTYVHLSLIVAAQPDNPTTYSCAAQAFQQFQVLLQRFIENEPFEHGTRVEIYARSRSLLSKLLQVPTFQGKIIWVMLLTFFIINVAYTIKMCSSGLWNLEYPLNFSVGYGSIDSCCHVINFNSN